MRGLVRDDRVELSAMQSVRERGRDVHSRRCQPDSERGIGQPVNDAQSRRVEPRSHSRMPERLSFAGRPRLKRTQCNVKRTPAPPPVEDSVSEPDSQNQVECAVDGSKKSVQRDHAERADVLHSSERIRQRRRNVVSEYRSDTQNDDDAYAEQRCAAVRLLLRRENIGDGFPPGRGH